MICHLPLCVGIHYYICILNKYNILDNARYSYKCRLVVYYTK